MTSPPEPAPSASAEPGSTYTYGHHQVVVDVHLRRTAALEAAFFLPHLRPGMRLLDAGCGPGSITIGLARAVAPGEATGIDREAGVLERGRSLAAEQDVSNLRFEAAGVYDLPYADASFDAVFAHTLLEHVRDPARALTELRRVLRPGGVIGVRDCDWSSGIFAPADDAMEQAVDLYARVWEHNGGHPTCGRQLRSWLMQAGFGAVESSASFRWDGTPASSRSFGELLAERFRLPNFIEPVLAMGWSGRETLTRISDGCEAWSRLPDAFAAMIMCESVAVAP